MRGTARTEAPTIAYRLIMVTVHVLIACVIAQTGVLMFGFYQMLTRAYQGVAVAQLPFEPIPLLRMISHRGLPEGSSPRLVSVVRCVQDS